MRDLFVVDFASWRSPARAPLLRRRRVAQATADHPTLQPRRTSRQGVGDIIVTAQRRSRICRTCRCRSATSMTRRWPRSTPAAPTSAACPGRVPSLNIESSFGRTFPRFYIRGLGNTDFDLNASQPVSLVYDDVVLENPILKGFPVVRRRPGRSAARAAGDPVRPQHAGRHRQVRHGQAAATAATMRGSATAPTRRSTPKARSAAS